MKSPVTPLKITQVADQPRDRVKALEFSAMLAVVLEYFRVSHFGLLPGTEVSDPIRLASLGISKAGHEHMPPGVALCAELSEVAEAKIERNDRPAPAECKSGDRRGVVELAALLATADNELEVILADLVQKQLRTDVVR